MQLRGLTLIIAAFIVYFGTVQPQARQWVKIWIPYFFWKIFNA